MQMEDPAWIPSTLPHRKRIACGEVFFISCSHLMDRCSAAALPHRPAGRLVRH